jgi:hypothetical protein
MEETSIQSVWNFDGAEFYYIFEIKLKVAQCLDDWDLENAYWFLRQLRREVDAKLKREKSKLEEEFDKEQGKEKEKETEKIIMDRKLKTLSDARETYLEDRKVDKEAKFKFYNLLETFYLDICYVMKKHGIYFREGDSAQFAILHR